jgi:molecular chaperone GrpE
VESLVHGVELVERKLRQTLESAGLERIAAEDAVFDPSTMEALMTVPTDSPEEDDHVADVFQPGYRYQGVLLRPARVRVKKYEA